MYIYDDNVVFNLNENRIAFLCDETADISTLPTTTQPGTQMAPNNVSCDPVDSGSMAYVIATGDVYILDSTDVWVLQPKHGGSQPSPSATTLAELKDVQLGTLVDGNLFAYDATASKWINSGNINDLQTKTLEEPIVIEGHEYDSVEDALQEISNMFVWDEG